MDKPATFDSNIYTAGGTVQAGGGIYISRKADTELLKLCREGTFVYILTARQVGKSSLMVQTASYLREEGIHSVIVDLTQIGVQVTQDQWYFGLVSSIADQLDLETDLVEWWEKNASVSMAQRLTLFLERVLLADVSGKVVIFIDEIDTTLSLPFADDFFAVIRHLYNARVQVPEFRRLSFVLLGVATPNDLIKDPSRTPFNIGQSVELTDFTIEEAAPLANGLSLPPDRAREVLGWILDWTGGHPYLTQRLCRTIAEMNEDTWTRSKVDDVVTDIFLNQKKTDHNLRFVADMLTVRAPNLTRVLKTYREIYRDRAVPDDHVSSVKSHLKLSGVVISEQGILRLRNAIYRKAFDENWIEKHLPTDQRLAIFASVMVLLSIFVTVFTTVFDNMSGIRYIGIASSIVTLIFSILAMVLGIRAIRNI